MSLISEKSLSLSGPNDFGPRLIRIHPRNWSIIRLYLLKRTPTLVHLEPIKINFKLKPLLAFTRIPGNAFSFWIRQTLRWSRGTPTLFQEPKDTLFAYLKVDRKAAEARESDFRERYGLEPLAQMSTTALYRKNLYLLHTLENATEGLDFSPMLGSACKALDVGSQDWHYVFGLERWLKFYQSSRGRSVALDGIELDGYGIYSDFHSRRDYAHAYAAQTGNANVRYCIGDFLKMPVASYDFISIFYPFVTRYQLLLWGLPLRFYSPPNFLSQSAALLRSGGCLLVFCHSQAEQDAFLELGRKSGKFTLLRHGPVLSDLVDFHQDIRDRRYSIWQKSSLNANSSV